jgi:pyruvate kinase
MPKAIDKAIAKIKSQRGLPIEVADACGIHRVAVYQWKRVPVERVHDVAAVIGMTPEEIRPDIFRPVKGRKSKAA